MSVSKFPDLRPVAILQRAAEENPEMDFVFLVGQNKNGENYFYISDGKPSQYALAAVIAQRVALMAVDDEMVP
jgi:hypothetical protein